MPTARPWSWASQTKTKIQAQFPALRVLFCGSDGFSIPSFHMLRELHLRRNDIISKLAVVTPADRPSGRGLKVLKPTPMTTLARQMQWPHSHAAKFLYTPDEMPPGSWDLIIAVSFGHKISSTVLAQCSAGGLNVQGDGSAQRASCRNTGDQRHCITPCSTQIKKQRCVYRPFILQSSIKVISSPGQCRSRSRRPRH